MRRAAKTVRRILIGSPPQSLNRLKKISVLLRRIRSTIYPLCIFFLNAAGGQQRSPHSYLIATSQSKAPALLNSFLHPSSLFLDYILDKPIRCTLRQHHLHKKRGAPLTTNHLLMKGDIWLTLILAVRRNPSFTIFFTN